MEEIKNTKIKVDDYGDMFAKVLGMDLVVFQQYGSYQGEYLVVLNDKGTYKFYIGHYGSCSGCDWLEAERDWDTSEVEYKDALEYCNGIQLKFAMPKTLWETLNDEQKQLLVEKDYYYEEEMKEEILKVGKELTK